MALQLAIIQCAVSSHRDDAQDQVKHFVGVLDCSINDACAADIIVCTVSTRVISLSGFEGNDAGVVDHWGPFGLLSVVTSCIGSPHHADSPCDLLGPTLNGTHGGASL